MLRFLVILFLSLFLTTSINAACNTKEIKEEREKQKTLKIMGYSGSKLDTKTGKYFKYDFKNCKWKKIKG